jgi:hypothetical protein
MFFVNKDSYCMCMLYLLVLGFLKPFVLIQYVIELCDLILCFVSTMLS